MSAAGWFIAYLFRWLPHRSPTGLFPVGHPAADAPLIATANFSLTVRRVRRALRKRDAWMLVVDSGGINVWCAAAGGTLNEHRVIDAITVTELAEKVDHREIILPALAAPGVDCGAIERETGFRAHFGPVSAADIPAYLQAGGKKAGGLRRFRFGLRHRLDMFLSMNFPVYLLMAVPLAIFWPHHLLGATILFWSALALLYALVDVIPGRTGWGQGACAGLVFALCWAALDGLTAGDPLRNWGWMAAAMAIFMACALDLAGIITPRKSDPEQLLLRFRCRRLGRVFAARQLGTIELRRARCRGCGSCIEICPLGVFDDLDQDHKAVVRDRDACFGCGACVKQCPESALGLRSG